MSRKYKVLNDDGFDHSYLSERFVCLFAECLLRGSYKPVWFKHVCDDMVERGWMTEKNGYYFLTTSGTVRARRSYDVNWMVKEEEFHMEFAKVNTYDKSSHAGR